VLPMIILTCGVILFSLLRYFDISFSQQEHGEGGTEETYPEAANHLA
jgi:hypothetical protein